MVSGHFFSAPPSGRSSRSFFCWDRSQVYGELAPGYGALAWHGHEMLSTGDLAASSVTMAIYGAMIAAALLRIGAGVLPHAYMVVIGAAGAAWIAAFALCLLEYAPMLLGPRR